MATAPSAPFPDVILYPGCTITVTLDDASAKVTTLNVYGARPVGTTETAPLTFPQLFVYDPSAAGQ